MVSKNYFMVNVSALNTATILIFSLIFDTKVHKIPAIKNDVKVIESSFPPSSGAWQQ